MFFTSSVLEIGYMEPIFKLRTEDEKLKIRLKFLKYIENKTDRPWSINSLRFLKIH